MILCILVAVLVSLWVVSYAKSYKQAREWKHYQGTNISFSYPAQWGLNFCGRGPAFIFPGMIRGDYKDNSRYPLELRGSAEYKGCADGRIVFDVQKDNQCRDFNKVTGKKLHNGLVLTLSEDSTYKGVSSINILQYPCANAELFSFYFNDPTPNIPEDGWDGAAQYRQYGSPQVNENYLLTTPQYKDIVKFAESIRIEKTD